MGMPILCNRFQPNQIAKLEIVVQSHAVFCLFIPLITAISYGQIIDLECNIACHVDKQKSCIS